MPNDTDAKREVLKELMTFARSLKAKKMREKYGPKDEPPPEQEGDEPAAVIEIEPDAPDQEPTDELAPKGLDALKALQADPEKLKALLGKK
jgi:hypothetical protein